MKLCLFISYNKNQENFFKYDIPYLNCIRKYFDKVILVTNEKPKNYADECLIFENEGYDFGFFYKAINKIDISNYSSIAFINNSNILVKNKNLDSIFSWSNKKSLDFWGITDSIECPPGIDPKKSYHIQSHFLVFENKSIPFIKEFFKHINFESFFKISNVNKLRQSIINKCEIGITQYMISKGLNVGSYFQYNVILNKYKKSLRSNMHVWLWEELIHDGYPLMKKKIKSGEWSFLPNHKNKNKYI